ncbi:type II toxin-antitoxin system RelE/ParE family toxin [Marinobacter sp. LV10MA510-1]|uniref:type II toxin-antitoxin system RelE/ParE family toxin n=1 Tax=Marinobacter sp. LV10MA510-1 TaxID=1415567 RepID=UPI000BF71656|nr:type II toxin-antitoxin system RelE/ParE family toxin [Marinobacter sp. LV10MA510-1]PFG09260.1 hypothetical protein ATI45_1627 [Marinobacter sp. LV10MA510-1]
MDLIFCINQNSFPAVDSCTGNELFDDAVQGVLALLGGGKDRCLFYYDSNGESLHSLDIAEGFTYENFLQGCDPDLQLFLYEVEDKSPALDALTDDQIDEMAAYNFYLAGHALDHYSDVYSLAWVTSGFLLSLATDPKWQKEALRISKTGDSGRFVDDFLLLKNVASQKHGKLHWQQLHTIDLNTFLSGHVASNEFIDWFAQLETANQKIVADKIKLAVDKGFQGGRPLFDSLNNSDAVREIRMSAFAGGAIRVLFKHHFEKNYILLIGFIKHSDDEGYAKNITAAERIYNNMLN